MARKRYLQSATVFHFTVFACIALLFADGTDINVIKGATEGVVNSPISIAADDYTATGTFASFGSFQMQTYRDALGADEQIQIYFEINDSESHTNDAIRIYFDLNHNHAIETGDTGIVIKRSPNAVLHTNINLFGAPTEGSSFPAGISPAGQWIIESTTGWKVELKIRASDLGLNFIPALFGMHIQVIDGNGPTTETYPNIGVNTVGSWANVKTRNPIEYVVLLDKSGSMVEDIDGNWPAVGTLRWNIAQKASDIFAHVYYAFRPNDDGDGNPYFSDKIGLLTYKYENSNYVIETVESLALLKDITEDGYSGSAGTAVAGPRTPIKNGLDTTFTKFSSGTGFEKIILLLSDGFHNEPSSDYDYEPYGFPAGTGMSDYQVNTVALGPDGSVGTDLLDDISTDFSGFGGAYIDALSETALADAFVENLFSHLYLNRETVDPTTKEFQVSHSDPKMLVMLVWHSTTGSDRNFRLEKADNSIVTTTDPGYHHYRNPTLGYEVAYYLLEQPSPTGTWQAIEMASTNPMASDNAFAIFDPGIYAFFSAEQVGEDLLLHAVLKENGQPIPQDSVTVKAVVHRPDEGIGTVISTTSDSCTKIVPVLQTMFDPKVRKVINRYQFAQNTKMQHIDSTREKMTSVKKEGMAAADRGESANNDHIVVREPLPLHIQRLHQLLEICDKDGLARSETTVTLYDDGTHGDQTAGDGLYSFLYTDADVEGTYTFDFTASGTSVEGNAFSRIKTLSIYRSVVVAPEITVFDSVIHYVDSAWCLAEYYVIPKSTGGEYYGPGHVSKVNFTAKNGEWQSDVIDHVNGIYSRVLRYSKSGDDPGVVVAVQGKPIVSGQEPPRRIPIYLWIIIIILLIVILVVIFLRKQN